jgi:hypothetical protein
MHVSPQFKAQRRHFVQENNPEHGWSVSFISRLQSTPLSQTANVSNAAITSSTERQSLSPEPNRGKGRSAGSSVVLCGLKFAVSNEEELDALENRTHPLQCKASSARLDYYWEAISVEEYALFIGRRSGLIGVKNGSCVVLSREDVSRVQADVTATLHEMGLGGEPRLHIQLFPDF